MYHDMTFSSVHLCYLVYVDDKMTNNFFSPYNHLIASSASQDEFIIDRLVVPQNEKATSMFNIKYKINKK